MANPIRIGTRDSELALWQANLVKNSLEEIGYVSILVKIKSEGDKDLVTPLYEMGVQGIFTRSLDVALLQNDIDIAVHSMKDVPIKLAFGLTQAAVLERGNYKDVFVPGPTIEQTHPKFLDSLLPGRMDHFLSDLTIATSSIRRQAQWLHRYPTHNIESIRGNVNTRLKKTEDSKRAGTIFAAAGLERINKKPANTIELDWMMPAPAQGAIVVLARKEDLKIKNMCRKLNHELTSICTGIEKDFLCELMGGCSTPISALAQTDGKEIYALGSVYSPDGKMKAGVQKMASIHHAASLGRMMAKEILESGAREILKKMWEQKSASN